MKKETGLMFKAPLVHAILAGQKTQTRRVFSAHIEKLMRAAAAIGELSHFMDEGHMHPNDIDYVLDFCPFGKPGDRIYVRETWAYGIHAMGAMRDEDGPFVFAADGTTEGRLSDQWLPSIHMPKHAARIWLEITGVRVERLQQISRADAIAEGIKFFNNDHECGAKNYLDRTDMDYSLCPTDSFETLWKSTGGDWDANPWVWVIDFKTISTTGRPA